MSFRLIKEHDTTPKAFERELARCDSPPIIPFLGGAQETHNAFFDQLYILEKRALRVIVKLLSKSCRR